MEESGCDIDHDFNIRDPRSVSIAIAGFPVPRSREILKGREDNTDRRDDQARLNRL
jgi:hypothetical protein